MTWSIIARDSATGQFGIAVATRLFAVGARVPHVAAGIGAIATQALVNPYYGIDGLKLLREGRKPRDIVETLISATVAARAGNFTSWTPRPYRFPYGERMHRLVRAYRGDGFSDCRQHAGRRARAGRHRQAYVPKQACRSRSG
jgi:hypothetical protein